MKNLQTFTDFINENSSLINENDEMTNRILDKILRAPSYKVGYDNLSKSEKQFLDNKSKGVVDDELDDIVNIESGHEFEGTLRNSLYVKFIYDETEECDEDPEECDEDPELYYYKHTGELFIDDEKYDATMYADKNYKVNSFDLHDGVDYVEFDDELEESFLEFFQQVGDKIKQSIV